MHAPCHSGGGASATRSDPLPALRLSTPGLRGEASQHIEKSSVVDADPGPNFHFNSNPNDADPHTALTTSFTHVGK
jgi:hypothetical protein